MTLVNSDTGEIVSEDEYLEALASRVRTEYRRSKDAIGEAVDAYFAIGQCLLEARQQLRSNEAFGAWFRSNEFGFTQQWAHVLRTAAEFEVPVRKAITSQLVNGGSPNIERAVKEVTGRDVGGSGAHVSNNSGDNEWYTPADYIKAAVEVMGAIDLDPASSPEANAVIGATEFFTERDNGLRKPWVGRVWMNPPYARPLIDDFCAKLAESFAAGDVSAACVLVNNATETGWFHALAEVASAMCFPRGRVKFWHPEKDAATPLQGQAVAYLGPDELAFRAEFLRFGFTVAL